RNADSVLDGAIPVETALATIGRGLPTSRSAPLPSAWHCLFRLLRKVKRVVQVRRRGIVPPQRLQVPPRFDQAQDRGGLVRRMIHVPLFCVGGNDDGGHTGAGTPSIP